jgi:hypothetical protein
MAKKVATKSAAKKKTGPNSQREWVMVTSGIEFWKPEKVGDSVEGEYIETLKYKNKFDKSKDGSNPQMKAIIRTDDGKQVALPSHGTITNAIEKNGKGFYHIEFDGKAKVKGYDKPISQYIVHFSAE